MTVRFLLAIALVLSLGACMEVAPATPVSPSGAQSQKLELGLLFENDGCKIYRFHDAGRYRYYSDCSAKSGGSPAQSNSSVISSNDCGKNCIDDDQIVTSYSNE